MPSFTRYVLQKFWEVSDNWVEPKETDGLRGHMFSDARRAWCQWCLTSAISLRCLKILYRMLLQSVIQATPDSISPVQQYLMCHFNIFVLLLTTLYINFEIAEPFGFDVLWSLIF